MVDERLAEAAVPIGLHVPAIGEIVGSKYRVERVVGRGGMAVVLAARHVQLGERVALKVLLFDPFARGNDLRTRFMQEAKIAAQLRNEHIARVVDVAALDDGTPYMVMEYVEGVELRELMKRDGRLPVALAVEYAVQACEGLAEAHAKGIVHRDLKPPNLIITSRSDGSTLLKILDFGISKLLSPEQPAGELTETGVVMGSPKYMSPEQFGTAASADTRSDIWALGTILYEMLAGEPAFNEPSIARVCARVTSGELPPSLCAQRSDVPEALERAVFSTLALDREDRTQDVADLASDILEAMGDPDATARSESIRAALGQPRSGQVPSQPKASAPMRVRMASRSGGRRIVVAPPPPTSRGKIGVAAVAVAIALGVGVWLLARPAHAPAAASQPVIAVTAQPPAPQPQPPPAAVSAAAAAPATSASVAAPSAQSAVPSTAPPRISASHSHVRPPVASDTASTPRPADTAKPVVAVPAPPAPAPSMSPSDLGTYR